MLPGKNDSCPCGSGKLPQACCGQPTGEQSLASAQWFALLRLGRHAELERSTRRFTSRYPEAGIAWKLLAGALAAQGKNALGALQRAARLLPGDAEAQANVGNALHAAGRVDESIASYRNAVAADPASAKHHHRLAVALRASGRLREVLASLRRAAELDPGNAAYHNELGSLLADLGVAEEAVECLQRAVDIQPDLAAAHCNLGTALRSLGQLEAAENAYRRAIDLAPEAPDPHFNLASLLKTVNRLPEAEAECQRAVHGTPTPPAALVFLAQFAADRGEFQQAEELVARALVLDPKSPEAWSTVPRLRRMHAEDTGWLRTALRLADRGLPPRKEARLHFAIGKCLDDLADYPGAFAHYRRANELVKSYQRSYDMQALTRTVERIERTFGRDFLQRHCDDGIASPLPVFVVGMPRSGTTLVEHMLAAHPQVHGANELPFWVNASAAYLSADEAGMPPVTVLRARAGEYLRLLEGLAGGASRVVDKMPVNFLSLGMIHAALPAARFIHVRRDPRDTCLSIYFQDFEQTFPFATDLTHLVHYYRQYARIMRQWATVVPADRMLDVPYEALVHDPELWSRRMLDFLGLPWDPRCRDFHAVERVVNTASNWQVRQPISSSSVNRWKHYEKFIEPLLLLDLGESPGAAARGS